jgi:hypothetical protein
VASKQHHGIPQRHQRPVTHQLGQTVSEQAQNPRTNLVNFSAVFLYASRILGNSAVVTHHRKGARNIRQNYGLQEMLKTLDAQCPGGFSLPSPQICAVSV